MLSGKECTITLEKVQSALRTKELTKFKYLKVDDGGEGLNVSRGRSENKGRGNRKRNRSKYRPKGSGDNIYKVQILPLSHSWSLQEGLSSKRGQW
jgi:hypothetical protein